MHPDGNAEVITESSHTSIFGEDSALQHQSMGNGGTAAAQSPTALQDEHLPGINGHTDLLQRDSAVCNATPKHPCFSTSAANAIATPAAVHSHLATSAADSRPATSALLKALLAQLTADSSSKPATAMPGASTVLTRPATSAQAGPQQHRPATSALRALLTTAAGSDGVEEALRCIRLMYGEDDQHADLVIVNEEGRYSVHRAHGCLGLAFNLTTLSQAFCHPSVFATVWQPSFCHLLIADPLCN